MFCWRESSFCWKRSAGNYFPQNKEVVVVVDGFQLLSWRTDKKTVKDVLAEIGWQLDEKDEVYPDLSASLRGGERIFFRRAVPVVIEADGKERKVRVLSRRVENVLREVGLTLDPFDKVEPSLDSFIFENVKITVTRVERKEVTEIKEIDFKTIEKKDKKLKWGVRKVKRAGEKGKREVKYLVVYHNGKEVARKKLATRILKKPVDEIVVVGTKIKIGRVQRGLASWYAYTGKMAAASTTFPKGTWLRVTAVNSGKQIFVQVNDYGPDPGSGKILDLDKEAFRKLAPLGAGVIEVKIEEIK